MSERLLDALLDIQRNSSEVGTGICTAVARRIGGNGWRGDLAAAFKAWSEFSGDLSYPIGHPLGDAEQSYWKAFNTKTMWTGKYGEARKRLLDHCIHYLSGHYVQGVRIDKADIPKGCKYLACDSDGRIFGYSHKPYVSSSMWIAPFSDHPDCTIFYLPGDPHTDLLEGWENSLISV